VPLRGSIPKPDRSKQIIEDYKSGLSVEKVARKHKTNKRTVYQICESGTNERNPGVKVRNTRSRQSCTPQKIISDYQSGLSIHEITKKHSTGRQRVLKFYARRMLNNKASIAVSLTKQNTPIGELLAEWHCQGTKSGR
jgi:Mor family transcriptional regulator